MVKPALMHMTNRVRAASVLVVAALCVGSLGAAGASGQALSPAAMEAFLLEAELADVRDAGDGVTRSRRATASDGRLTHDVHIQTVEVSLGLFAVAGARPELNFRDSYAFNVAAYRLAALLGLDNVPMSVSRRFRGEPAAVTWWVDDVAMNERERMARQTFGPSPARTYQQLYTMYVFDELIQNRDRNQGNVLWTTDWKMWLIDHTRAFRSDVEITAPDRLTRIGRELLDNLRSLMRKALDTATGDFLDLGQRSSLMRRRDLLVRHFDALIDQRGEEAVVFDDPRAARALAAVNTPSAVANGALDRSANAAAPALQREDAAPLGEAGGRRAPDRPAGPGRSGAAPRAGRSCANPGRGAPAAASSRPGARAPTVVAPPPDALAPAAPSPPPTAPPPDAPVPAPAPRPAPTAPRSAPPPGAPPPPPDASLNALALARSLDFLLADAVAAEMAGDPDTALTLYAGVLDRDADNRTAQTGRERVETAAVELRLRQAAAAFAAARYDEARRLFQSVLDVGPAPAAEAGLQRLTAIDALRCPAAGTCGTLTLRVTPPAAIFVNERPLGVATRLELRLAGGRYRIRFETDAWRYPQVVRLAAGERAEVDVDLADEGFPK